MFLHSKELGSELRYNAGVNDVTPGMSTESGVSDRKAVTCLSDTYATSRWNGINFPFSKEARCEITAVQCMHPRQCFRQTNLFIVQNSSTILHSDVSSVIAGTVGEDDVASARSSGKPNKNHQDIRDGRHYQYASTCSLFCVNDNQCIGFFVSTLKVVRLNHSDHHYHDRCCSASSCIFHHVR